MHWVEGISSRRAITHSGRVHPRVTMVEYENGRTLLIKVTKDPATVVPEAMALQALYQAGAPVPALIDYQEAGVIVLEYVPGIAWGDLTDTELSQAIPMFWSAWDCMKEAWYQIESQLSPWQIITEVDEFVRQMDSVGSWICDYAVDITEATKVWPNIVRLARSAKRTFGALDYNPYNVLYTGDQVVFLDFESFGLDWDFRRLWQYSTRIRTKDGQDWYPALRSSLYANVQADAHYILFAVMALYQQCKLKGFDREWAIRCFDQKGANHPDLAIWRSAWQVSS